MIKSLQRLSVESFFTCKEIKLSSSYYCLFKYIYVLMNKREIYFLCENTSDEICLSYPKNRHCRHCRRLKKYNLLFEKIEREKITKTFKLIYSVNQITDHVLKYRKYYILPELKDKYCDLCHFRVNNNVVKND